MILYAIFKFSNKLELLNKSQIYTYVYKISIMEDFDTEYI